MTVIINPYGYYVYLLASSIPTEYTRFDDRKYGYVFYVGKGIGIRMHWHEEEARVGHECKKCNLIRTIWSRGGTVKKRIVFTTLDESEAYRHEYDLIRKIGRENLVNVYGGLPNHQPRDNGLFERARLNFERKEEEEGRG